MQLIGPSQSLRGCARARVLALQLPQFIYNFVLFSWAWNWFSVFWAWIQCIRLVSQDSMDMYSVYKKEEWTQSWQNFSNVCDNLQMSAFQYEQLVKQMCVPFSCCSHELCLVVWLHFSADSGSHGWGSHWQLMEENNGHAFPEMSIALCAICCCPHYRPDSSLTCQSRMGWAGLPDFLAIISLLDNWFIATRTSDPLTQTSPRSTRQWCQMNESMHFFNLVFLRSWSAEVPAFLAKPYLKGSLNFFVNGSSGGSAVLRSR